MTERAEEPNSKGCGWSKLGDIARESLAYDRQLEAEAANRRLAARTPDHGFVNTTIAAAIRSGMTYAADTRCIVMVVGQPGVGKSTALEQFREATASTHWFMPASEDTKALVPMLDELCLRSGVEQPSSGGAAAMRRALVRRMQGTGGVLIVDEAQHLCLNAIEGLRAIYDQAGIGLVFFGHPNLEDNLKKSPQVTSRIARRVLLQPPSANDVSAVACAVAGDAMVLDREALDYLFTFAMLPGSLRWVVNIVRMAVLIRKGMPDLPVLRALHTAVTQLNIGGTP